MRLLAHTAAELARWGRAGVFRATLGLTTAAQELVPRLTQAGHPEAMPVLLEVLEVLEAEAEARRQRRVARLRRAARLSWDNREPCSAVIYGRGGKPVRKKHQFVVLAAVACAVGSLVAGIPQASGQERSSRGWSGDANTSWFDETAFLLCERTGELGNSGGAVSLCERPGQIGIGIVDKHWVVGRWSSTGERPGVFAPHRDRRCKDVVVQRDSLPSL